MDDIGLEKPLGLTSLATRFEGVDERKGEKNAMERVSTNKSMDFEEKSKKKKKTTGQYTTDEFAPFDMSQTIH